MPDGTTFAQADRNDRASEDPLLTLATLIQEGQHQAALQLASQLRERYEGQPDFDVLFGRALMNQGDYQAATFALERALIMVPRDIDARLTLAEAYLGLGNTRASRRQLEQTARRTLTATQQQRQAALNRRLQQQEMARQRQNQFTVSAELQYFTNINSGLNVDTLTDIAIVGPDVVVDDESKAQPAPAVTLQASAERTTPLTQRLRRTAQVGLTTRQSPFADARNLGAVLAVNWQHDRGRSGGVQLIPSWTTDGTQVTASIAGQQNDLIGSADLGLSAAWSWRDAHSVLTSLSLSNEARLGAFAAPWRLAVSGNASTESANNYLGAGARVQPRWTPAGPYSFQITLGYQVQGYLEESALYEAQRIDQTVRGEFLALRPWREQGAFTGRVTGQNRFSNQSLYAFQGVELAVGYQHSW